MKHLNSKELCQRCGTCCRKGGPGLHLEDKSLIESGAIPASALYTLRKGEIVWDNVADRHARTDTDIIKIKEKEGSRACIFFDEAEKCCTVYEKRPIECRVLQCQDTREIEGIYDQNRLTRKDLIGGIEALWELVESHQTECDYARISECVEQLKVNPDAAAPLKQLHKAIRYDDDIREMLREKAIIPLEMREFLFGRPIRTTLRAMGVTVREEGKCLFLRPI